MQKSLREVGKELQTECGKAFWIGGDIHFAPMHLNGHYFSFKPDQTMFLHFLKKYEGSIEKASFAVGWSMEDVGKFFSTRKWRQYKEMLLAKFATRNGDLVDFWWDFMLDGARGYVERYEGACDLCKQDYKLSPAQAAQYQDENLDSKFSCMICKQPVALALTKEEFKPSREQVQCASEIGQRVEPKRERVHHTFSDETYVFSGGEEVPQGGS